MASKLDQCMHALALKVYRGRYKLVCVWIVLTIVLLPCAVMQILTRTIALQKTPPDGSESAAAMDLFVNNFGKLATGRIEMVVFRCSGKCRNVAKASKPYMNMVIDKVNEFGAKHPGSVLSVQSYDDFDSMQERALLDNPMVSMDEHQILLRWMWSIPVELQDDAESFTVNLEKFMDENINSQQDVIEAKLTGHVTLAHAMKMSIFEFPLHEAKTVWLPILILGYVLQSPRLLLLALVPMLPELIVSIGLMYFVSLALPVTYYGLMMMALLVAALSWDYALFMLTRYKAERELGKSVEDAIVTSISHSGSLIAVSAVVLSICWCTMLGMPGMFRSFALAAAIAIMTSALSMITLVPSLLAIYPWLGPPASPALANGGGGGPADPAFREAVPFMGGWLFRFGGVLTKWPINLIIIVVIYTGLMPLTLRFLQNFEASTFKFTGMGHSYEMTMPRGQDEWLTATQIQHDFTSKEGVPMPLMILAQNSDPEPKPTAAPVHHGFFHRPHWFNRGGGRETDDDGNPLTGTFMSQNLIDADCKLMNSIITATAGTPYNITADNFVAPSGPSPDSDSGGVVCRKLWQLKVGRVGTRWFAGKMNQIMEQLWQSTITEKAALTFIMPKLDPFGPDAFKLVNTVRRVINDEQADSEKLVPGLKRTVFGPATVLMDLTEMAEEQLPICFLVCVATCFTLISLWFGAAIVPVKLLLTVIVPITWCYGAALYVYNDGALAQLGITSLMPMGDAGLDWTVPLFSLTFLVGLALDYDFFLFERVYDFRKSGFGDREAIQLGLSASGGTIMAAGLILGLTFISQMFAVLPTMNQTGFVYVFSIVIDTFLVRTIVVPALLSMSPWLNYWPTVMPRPKYEWLEAGASPLDAGHEAIGLVAGESSDAALE